MSLLTNISGSAINATFRDGYEIWEILRGNINTLNAQFLQGTGSPEGAVVGTPSNIYLQTDGVDGTTVWVKATGTGNTGWRALPTLTSAGALTGKTVSFREFWPGAVNAFDVLTSPWHSTAAAGPTHAAISGSNVLSAGLTFPDASSKAIYKDFVLPSDWTGDLDLRIFWRTTATTGNVAWQVQTAFAADGATIDPAYNAAQIVTDAAQGTASRRNTATQLVLTATGAAAGSHMFLKITRDGAHASDTIAADAVFLGAELTYRRALAA